MANKFSAKTKRFDYIDIARFYGIFLVYYGHVVERFMYLKIEAAALQYKYIYSFHMVLFFFLSGMVISEKTLKLSFVDFIKKKFKTRVIPYLFFNFILLVLSLFLQRDFPPFPLETVQDYFRTIGFTLIGVSIFNIPTWFIMALFAVELIHYFLNRFYKDGFRNKFFFIILFYFAGYYLNLNIQFISFEKIIGINYYLFHEAIIMFSFYLIGSSAIKCNHIKDLNFNKSLIYSLLGVLVIYFTYNLNQGPFRYLDAVVILLSGHGHIFWFPFTAIVGCMTIIYLARASISLKFFSFLGKNIITVYCFNGIFYHSFNGPFAVYMSNVMPMNYFNLTFVSTVFSILTMGLSIPFIFLFNKYCPQLIGKK